MTTVSFMSANFVAREAGYQLTGGWEESHRITNERFEPLETFGDRFEELLVEVRAMGFEALDVWVAHLNWTWATEEHVAIARELLARLDLAVTSLAGSFGATAEEVEAACRVAAELGTETLGGRCVLLREDRAAVLAALERFGVRLAIENHGGQTPDDILALIGDGGGGRLGTAVDTGWYAVDGCAVPQAIERLGEHMLHVHLKDVLIPDRHVTCRFGEGVVPLEESVRALRRIGYAGPISVEHEPEDRDPTDDCIASLELLQGWLGAESRGRS